MNQATLSYSGGVIRSNTVTGEIADVLSASKTAVSQSYTPGETVTYVLSIVNDGASAVTDLTVTDDLGGYEFECETVYPLEYVEGSLLFFQDGTLRPEPDVTAGPPLRITGIDVPAEGNVTLIYQADVTSFAPLGEGAEITNTAEIEGGCVRLTASATIPMADGPELTISKSLCPETVTENGELTYTFVIQNTGSEDAAAEDAVTVTDTFDPVLSDLTVELDGAPLTARTDYAYNKATGEFATTAGRIEVPGATYTRSPDGVWTTTPGVAVLTVTGTL